MNQKNNKLTMNTKYILSVMAVAAVYCTTACTSHHKTTDESVAETVDVALPEVDSVTFTAEYPGSLYALATVDVVGRANGLLVNKNYTSGQYVTKGTVLFHIEDSKYRDAVHQAEAALATATSSRDYARSHYEAVKQALESDAVSKMEVIQAESALRQAEASIENAEAALATARTNLRYCTVTAPISGYVSSSTYDVGNYINGEGSPVKLSTIYDRSSLLAKFAVEEERLTDILGKQEAADVPDLQNVALGFSDTIQHKYYGNLTYVAPSVDSSTGTVTLQCRVDNKYNELRPGMFVKINLPYRHVNDAVMVKDASLSSNQLGKYLYVVNDSDKVVYTPVTVGPLHNDSMRVILSGLTPGSRYITKAMLKVRNGMTVHPVIVK